jgi:glycosyltransferase involved in cell wall biosynthesis
MDLPRIYADLDVLVVSSRNEGTPVSIIEAMAAGCPVVATSVGGIPDMVTHGETGRLVGSGDEAALAQAVLDTVTDRDEAQGQVARARDRARERYGVARLVQDIEALYSRLLGARGLA